MPLSFSFGRDPSKNHTYCVQDSKISGFLIYGPDHKDLMYIVTSKTATTRSEYKFRRAQDDVGLATLTRGQIPNEYTITGSLDDLLGKIKFKDKGIDLQIAEDKYHAIVQNRAQAIEFKDKSNKMVLTVDKKIISLKDQYHLTGSDDFPHLVAQVLAVAIDDFYHHGVK